MKPLVIIKVGDTFPALADTIGDFEHWIARGLCETELPLQVIDPRHGAPLPVPADIAGAVVTGSHAMVSDRAPWSERLAVWLRDAVAQEVPLLGICYGHQLLAHALGGEVDYHPQGIEIGSVRVTRTKAATADPLFARLPEEFAAHVIHRQSVRQLPPDAVLLAGNGFEPHHAFRIGETTWGVQFHPEFDHHAMGGYIDHLADDLARVGTDVPALKAQLAYTRCAADVLKEFGRFSAKRLA